MGRPKKVVEGVEEVSVEVVADVAESISSIPVKSEKEKLLELYEEMKARGIRSISDIENQIARQ